MKFHTYDFGFPQGEESYFVTLKMGHYVSPKRCRPYSRMNGVTTLMTTTIRSFI